VPDAVRPTDDPDASLAGTLILGRYRLESLLRRGGMGSVWRAEHVQLKSPIAVKLLEPEVAKDQTMLQRFHREAQAAAALRSPNVVQIFDHGVDQGRAFIAMEMLEGETLSERIARVGRLPPSELFRFLTDVLRAMHKAHEAGIIHRDLKPDNVFICKDDPEYAKVLDFGVAKVKKGAFGEATGGFGTQTGLMLGTPYYMSPEQAQAKVIDPRTDLWSIGVVAFEALLGRRPFQADSLGDLVLAICTAPTPIPSRFGPVPPGFDEWFVHATQRDPARRFPSAREMAEELDRVLVPEVAPARRRFITSGVPAVGSLPAPAPLVTPVGRKSPSLGPEAADLELTTGQRSVVSRLSPASVPKREQSFALLALVAAGVLIVVGVIAFAVGGGARALHQADRGQRAAAPPREAPAVTLEPPNASAGALPPLASAKSPTSSAIVAPR
jgi:eukaryotic-like serine/threonine-protein kinase